MMHATWKNRKKYLWVLYYPLIWSNSIKQDIPISLCLKNHNCFSGGKDLAEKWFYSTYKTFGQLIFLKNFKSTILVNLWHMHTFGYIEPASKLL